MSRILPNVNALTEPFWRGGVDGHLHLQKCKDCKRFLHPPTPICRYCGSSAVGWEQVSGLATIESFTINHQAWRSDLAEPYAIAIVLLDEGVRLTTNIVDCKLDAIFIGQRVKVRFEAIDDIFLPLFEPCRTGAF